MAQVTIQQAFELALQYHRAGRLQEAEQVYRQILAQQPNHADALHHLGIMAHQAGRIDIAVDLIRRAIALNPNWPEARNNLGNVLKDGGQLDQAIAAYRQAIGGNPNLAEAHYNLGNVLRDSGQLDAAIAAFGQAIAVRPDYTLAHTNLGNVLQSCGRPDDAIAAYRQAVALRPDYAEAHSNLGNALKDTGQLDEAVDAHQRAISLRADYAEAHYNLGNALRAKAQLDEAVAAFRQAIALRPDYAKAHSNLGNALKGTGQLDLAIAAYRQAIALRPGFSDAHSNLLFSMHFHPDYDAKVIADELRCWNRQHAEPLRQFIQPHRNDRSPDRPLRIGYVSPDFRQHVVGRNLLPLFRQHDRREFQITCYSNVRRADVITSEFRQNADCWRDIIGLSDEQAAEQILADRIDILVDLALHTADNRLLIFARKPAPVQVTFAGYPGSTGLTAIDYRLSDPYLDPVGLDESIYSERTIRLPDSFWCYDPLDCKDLAVNGLPALSLSKGVMTFGCLSNFCKVNDSVLALWSQVLHRVKGSRLLVLSPQGGHRQRMLEQLSRLGIDPGRVEFVAHQPRRAYLELYHRIDVGLDTFPYNGHTTSLDSFWMGVPVVTLVGQSPVSRAGWCQLSNLGLNELAAQTPAQFVNIAVELAENLARLKELRSTLRQRMERSPLMDASKFARNIEAAYRQIWHQWCD
jgi:predicted O-linked N-acetylglucosamine transferase (SPINDLY family)